MKILLFLAGWAGSLLCRLLGDCCTPGYGLRLPVTWVWPSSVRSFEVVLFAHLVVSPAHLLWPCPQQLGGDSAAFRPQIRCCSGVFAIGNRKCTVCASGKPLEERALCSRDSAQSFPSVSKIGHRPDLVTLLWILMTELLASPQRDLPHEKLAI